MVSIVMLLACLGSIPVSPTIPQPPTVAVLPTRAKVRLGEKQNRRLRRALNSSNAKRCGF